MQLAHNLMYKDETYLTTLTLRIEYINKIDFIKWLLS